MIKAVFFDIDGTLLSFRTHQVLPSTIEAFNLLRQRGIKTFISSGRPLVLIPPFPLTFDGYITVNGGYCFTGDTIIHRHPIDASDCRKWCDYVEQNDLCTMCFTEKDMFINRIDPVAVQLQSQLGFEMPPVRPLSEAEGQEIFQFIAIQPAARDTEVLSMLSHSRMPRWHPIFSDLIPNGSSKAIGIEKMLAHFGIRKEEAMAFGDGANDIEMLEYVGCGVAMGNASDEVKQHADYVTDDVDSDGILHAVKEIITI